MHVSMEYYLNDIIVDYLYLENIIPLTPVDVSVDMTPYDEVPTLDFGRKEFRIMDRNIYNFIRFIEKCEEQEENACSARWQRTHNVSDITPLINIRGQEQLSTSMKNALLLQIAASDGKRELSNLIENDKALPYPKLIRFKQ